MQALRATARYWVPIVLAVVCFIVAGSVRPLVSYALIVSAFALLLEAGTALFERAGSAGSMKDYRQ